MATMPVRWDEERAAPRDPVLHRTRAITADGQVLSLTVVNVSEGGLMARCDAAVAPADMLTVELPILGRAAAEVRWALGGRIGCRLERSIAAADYRALLAAMT